MSWGILICRLLSPSRIYKQLYDATANKTELVAACLQLLDSNPSLTYDSVVRRLADGVAMMRQEVDHDAEYLSGYTVVDNTEVQQFSQHDLLDHAAFVVQQIAPVLGRHALKVAQLHTAATTDTA